MGILTVLFLLTIDTGVEGLNPFRTVSTKARIESYETASRIFLEHPVLGVGFNAYRYAQNEYGYRVSEKWETSHADAGTDNSFLFVLATTGIIGFSAYVYLWLRIIVSVRRRLNDGSQLSVVTLSSIVSVFAGAFFINVLFYPFIMAWLWYLLALSEKKK